MASLIKSSTPSTNSVFKPIRHDDESKKQLEGKTVKQSWRRNIDAEQSEQKPYKLEKHGKSMGLMAVESGAVEKTGPSDKALCKLLDQVISSDKWANPKNILEHVESKISKTGTVKH